MASVRTIFLLIRGIDQTGRAFEKPKKELNEFQLAQKRLARSSYRLLFAGAAFLTFGLMAAKGLAGLIDETSRGMLYTEDFARSVGRLKKSLSEAFLNNFEDEISNITEQIDRLSQNEFLSGWIANGLALIVGLSITAGGIAVAAGLTGLIKVNLLMPLLSAIGSVFGLVGGALGISSLAAGVITVGIILLLEITRRIIWGNKAELLNQMREAGIETSGATTFLTSEQMREQKRLGMGGVSEETMRAIENHITVNMYGNIEGFEGMTYEELVQMFGITAADEIINALNINAVD